MPVSRPVNPGDQDGRYPLYMILLFRAGWSTHSEQACFRWRSMPMGTREESQLKTAHKNNFILYRSKWERTPTRLPPEGKPVITCRHLLHHTAIPFPNPVLPHLATTTRASCLQRWRSSAHTSQGTCALATPDRGGLSP